MPRTWVLISAFVVVYLAITLVARESYGVGFAQIAAGMALGLALVALSIIDLRTWRLPDIITLPLLAAGLVVAWLVENRDVVTAALAALFAVGALAGLNWIYLQVRGRSGLGFGDAKLFGAAGAWVGFEGLASTLLLACLTALVAVAAAVLSGREVQGSTALPFGPFLCLGLWATWNFGPLI
ncbi:A24 family peptidase [Hyphomicrobium sp.]|uniref:prepilin peptidase n=1 Tax=Hyphomicrobium sp. TaxID=82 RepID=UPI002E312FC5|nr:A24 family peptidase [Hyphomicrobium sp.]HEX2840995.1 A24 family peptidase [Hyphomicrobium sp.]